jgi:hypothetical protein
LLRHTPAVPRRSWLLVLALLAAVLGAEPAQATTLLGKPERASLAPFERRTETFSASAGTITATVWCSGGSPSIRLAILDPAGTTLGSTSGRCVGDISVTSAVATGTGTYRIRIRETAGYPTTYCLNVTHQGGTQSTLTAVGAALRSDAGAAAQVRPSTWEPRPQNSQNQVVPSADQVAAFRTAQPVGGGRWTEMVNRVSGNYTGTTDEIIQWAAWKWGLDEDTVRAQAVVESYWDQNHVSGRTYGLMQVSDNSSWDPGAFPAARDSTAFNIDYQSMIIRAYYEAVHPWMSPRPPAGDMDGALGLWYWGGGWHRPEADAYAAQIRKVEAGRDWEKPLFVGC